MARVRMGEMVISADPDEELVALGLGSCIGLAMVDGQAAVAGLAHVVLPECAGADGPAARFADLAVPELLARVIERGARRSRLQVAIAGGASMFATTRQLDVGARNQAAVHDALRTARLGVDAVEIGGDEGRTMRVRVGSGLVTTRTAGRPAVPMLPRRPGTRTRASVVSPGAAR